MRTREHSTFPAIVWISLVVLESIIAVMHISYDVSAYSEHDPIYIDGNANFTFTNGVTGGIGTPTDPFIIEEWEIDASSTPGIRILNAESHFVIRNVFVHSGQPNFCNGILLSNVSNGRIENSSILDNYEGVFLRDSSNVSVEYNNISGNIHGIILRPGANVTIKGNMIQENYYGVSLLTSPNVTITENTISNNAEGLVMQFSMNDTVSGNTFTNDGIYLIGLSVADFNSHTMTSDNQINDKPLHYYKDASGVNIDNIPVGQLITVNCTNVLVSDIQVNSSSGFQIVYVNNLIIRDSRASQNDRYGMDIAYSENVTISATTISSNSREGLVLSHVDGVTIEQNEISSNNGDGVVLDSVTNITIDENIVVENNGAGLHLFTSTNATISGNYIALNNNSGGVPFDNPAGISLESSTGILVYNNTLVDNDWQGFDNSAPGNSWDNGYPVGGNFWSDYAESDNCSGPNQDVCPDPDGIGDRPYDIDTDTHDNYPLMRPYNTPPILSWSGEVNYTSGGLNPRSGNQETVFEYRILYQDADNDLPKQNCPFVHLLSNGSDINGSPFGMTLAGWIESPGNYIAGAIFNLSTTLTPFGNYSYRFEVMDIRGLRAIPPLEENGPTVSLLENYPPEARSILIDGNSKNTPDIVHILSESPILEWTYYDQLDPNPIQRQYQIRVGTGPGLQDVWTLGPVTGIETSVKYSGLSLAGGTDYYFAIRVKDDKIWSEWNETLFHTNTPPPVPILLEPPNGTTNGTVGRLELSWEGVVDADGDLITYYWFLSEVSDFSSLVDSGTTTGTTANVTASESTKYYWRILIWDGWEFGGNSTAFDFSSGETVEPDITPPLPPTNLAVAEAGNRGTLVLTWNASASPDVRSYRVYKSGEKGGSYALVQEINETVRSFIDTSLEDNRIYWYYVTSVDESENESDPSNIASGETSVEIAERESDMWLWILLLIVLMSTLLIAFLFPRRRRTTIEDIPEENTQLNDDT